MPAYTEQDPERIAERQREKEVARARLARLVEDAAADRPAPRDAVRSVNGNSGAAGDPSTRCTRCSKRRSTGSSYWRTASHEINYRRFFDVNTLAGIRVEEPDVFEATHALLGRLLGDGSVQGVRIDHPDGLFDPRRYFDDAAGARRASRPETLHPAYVVAEKILSGRERLPDSLARRTARPATTFSTI